MAMLTLTSAKVRDNDRGVPACRQKGKSRYQKVKTPSFERERRVVWSTLYQESLQIYFNFFRH